MSDEHLANWIGAHVRPFEFYKGVPKLAVPDNARAGVTKVCRYDPDPKPTYREMKWPCTAASAWFRFIFLSAFIGVHRRPFKFLRAHPYPHTRLLHCSFMATRATSGAIGHHRHHRSTTALRVLA
jgi:hypothetical protein